MPVDLSMFGFHDVADSGGTFDPWSGGDNLPTLDNIQMSLNGPEAAAESIHDSWGDESTVSTESAPAGAEGGGDSMGESSLFPWLMLGGMTAQAGSSIVNGIYAAKADERWAQAMETIAGDKADAAKSVAETNAGMMTTVTGMQVLAMMYQVNQQHDQAMSQMVYMDMADQRRNDSWKMQLSNDIRSMQLAINAQIHADNLQYSQLTIAERNRHDEELKRIENGTAEEEPVDPATLMT